MEKLVSDQEVNLEATATPHDILAAKVNSYREHLEKIYLAKSDLWQTASEKCQAAQDKLTKYENKIEKQRRAQGLTCFNSDGTLSFLSGYANESHLREPLEIIKELLRYAENEMLRLRQTRVESLLVEFITSLNHDLLIGRFPDGSREYFQLKQNLWAGQNVQLSLNQRHGLNLSKADIIRKLVSNLVLSHFELNVLYLGQFIYFSNAKADHFEFVEFIFGWF